MREVTPLIWADEFARAQALTWSWSSFVVGFLLCLGACAAFVLVARAALQRAALAKAEEHAARLVADALADRPGPADPLSSVLSAAVASGAASEDEIEALRRAMGGR